MPILSPMQVKGLCDSVLPYIKLVLNDFFCSMNLVHDIRGPCLPFDCVETIGMFISVNLPHRIFGSINSCH
jgi:hypothetical protein